MLIECVGTRIINATGSPITMAYWQIRGRRGNKKAKVAAARHMLRAIYHMLKRNQDFGSYLGAGGCVDPAMPQCSAL